MLTCSNCELVRYRCPPSEPIFLSPDTRDHAFGNSEGSCSPGDDELRNWTSLSVDCQQVCQRPWPSNPPFQGSNSNVPHLRLTTTYQVAAAWSMITPNRTFHPTSGFNCPRMVADRSSSVDARRPPKCDAQSCSWAK